MRRARGGTAALAVAVAGLAACGPYARPSHEPFSPTRYDYEAFRAARPEGGEALPDPNYLPFMAHRMEPRSRKKEDLLVFCRWDESRFPLAVHVEPPRIHPRLWNEFKPQEPGVFVDAAWRALESWENALGRVVSFRRAADWTKADLRVELVGESGPAPAEGVQVLGTTPLSRACRVSGRAGADRLDVSFRVPVIRIYVADQHGLLPPDQVERNVLHEMGHALGMKSHSPIPADLMFEVARDRRVSRLSREDVNSFLALYRIPNGTIYARVPRGAPPPRPAPQPPEGGPRLAATPYVESRLGFALRVPEGWRLIPAQRGVVAIDGLAWDYEGSFQVIVHGYESIASYVRRHGGGHVREGELVAQGPLLVAGRPAFHMTVSQQDGAMIEEHVFIETGDGRVIVVIEEAPADLRAGFQPWFDAMLGSLEVLPSQLPSPPVRPERAAHR